MNSKKKSPLDFPYAIKSFMGYLDGTQKSIHTIKNYKLDLLSFQNFLQEQSKPSHTKRLADIDADDLESYQNHLRAHGLKTNTRRRKLMTLRKFLSYLHGRKKLPIDFGRSLPTPHKLEKFPLTVSASGLLQAIEKLPKDTELDFRNRALLWTLLETGCLISEAAKIRFDDWSSGSLEFHGKSPRKIPISPELFQIVQELKQKRRGDSAWLFHGFNKFGALGSPISSRGIEILVKSYATRLGYPEIVPRTFRHSIIVEWLKREITQDEIQRRLGLKSAYAFRSYRATASE
jgi:site-specific recombinase XerD